MSACINFFIKKKCKITKKNIRYEYFGEVNNFIVLLVIKIQDFSFNSYI